jgi:hypothetical protein
MIPLQGSGWQLVGGWPSEISIASVWQQRRPVIKDLAASSHRLCIDTSLCRTVALAELANAIPRSGLTVEAMRSHHNGLSAIRK